MVNLELLFMPSRLPSPKCYLVATAMLLAATAGLPGPAAQAAPSHPASAARGASAITGEPVPCGDFQSGNEQQPDFISAVQFANSQVGWAVGSQVWATRNGGRSWSAQAQAGVNLTGLDVISPAQAWVFSVQYPAIYSTTDGGVHWSTLAEPPEQIDSVHFVSASTGFAVAGGAPAGPSGMPQCGGVLLASSNAGKTWRQVPSPPNVQSACFSNSEDGWLSAGVGQHADIYHSSNGGQSWQLSFAPPLSKADLAQGATVAALAELQCAQGAVWALYLGFGAEMSQEPWFAYRGSTAAWQPVFSEGYTEVGLTGHFPHQAPAGYSGPFSALSSGSAIFVGEDPVSDPISAAVDLVSADGRQMYQVGADPNMANPTGVAFTSAQDGWLAGEVPNKHCSDSTGPSCPWVVDQTVNGGKSWKRSFTYT